MIILSHETENLAYRIADAQRLSVDVAIREALLTQARVAGIEQSVARRRMTVEQILSVGAEIASLPLLDPRSPDEIMDDFNSL
jgi:antitoxin VapB